jgi:hypothetical protein
MKRLGTLLFALSQIALPLAARTFDLTDAESARLRTGATVSIDFGVWTYAQNNPGASPYPTSLELMILAPALTSDAAAIPDSTLQYFPGWLFEARLESLDGSAPVPFHDAAAARLGLPDGLLLVTPGTHQGREVALISASLAMSPAAAEALFGQNLGNYNDAARIWLSNLGEPLDIGLGPGYTVRQSVSVPNLAGAGDTRAAGLTGRVLLHNPEPSTWLLAAAGAALIAGRRVSRQSGR